LRGEFASTLRLYVSCAISVLHACQAGVSEKKNQSPLTHRNESTRIHDGEQRGRRGEAMARHAEWIADGLGGRGLVPVRSSSRVRQKLEPRVSYFPHEAGCRICQADFLKGQRERASR